MPLEMVSTLTSVRGLTCLTTSEMPLRITSLRQETVSSVRWELVRLSLRCHLRNLPERLSRLSTSGSGDDDAVSPSPTDDA
ncbi:hypothetical protein MTP99_004635 [Tenebrio molitor]|nr:hypothetical protein MTP99_004635 [Tenebrio molitor]